jgi:hypothetical protein
MKRVLVVAALFLLPSLAHAAGARATIAALLNTTPGATGFGIRFDGRRVKMGKAVAPGVAFRVPTRMYKHGLTLKPGKYMLTGVYNDKVKGLMSINAVEMHRVK